MRGTGTPEDQRKLVEIRAEVTASELDIAIVGGEWNSAKDALARFAYVMSQDKRIRDWQSEIDKGEAGSLAQKQTLPGRVTVASSEQESRPSSVGSEEGDPTPEVETQKWINVEAVNLRKGPGMSHAVVHVLSANDMVRTLGRDGRWLRVEWVSEEDDAVQGWISGRFLSDSPVTREELNPGSSPRPIPRQEPLSPTASPLAIGLLVFYIPAFLVAALIAVKVHRSRKKERLQAEIGELVQIVAERIKTCFLVEPCPRCHEVQNRLLQISPNGRSVQLQCTTCNRKYWAGASNPHGYKIGKNTTHSGKRLRNWLSSLERRVPRSRSCLMYRQDQCHSSKRPESQSLRVRGQKFGVGTKVAA